MIREFRKQDTISVADLVWKTFKQFNGNDYFDYAGVQATLDCFDSSIHSEQTLYDTFATSDIIYVYEKDNEILGIIRGSKNKINTFFVDETLQGQGIGKQLINVFEHEALLQKTKLIEINSSIYAAPFYEKMGYIKKSEIENFMGLKVYFMEKLF